MEPTAVRLGRKGSVPRLITDCALLKGFSRIWDASVETAPSKELACGYRLIAAGLRAEEKLTRARIRELCHRQSASRKEHP